jgi:hypothetical protein
VLGVTRHQAPGSSREGDLQKRFVIGVGQSLFERVSYDADAVCPDLLQQGLDAFGIKAKSGAK